MSEAFDKVMRYLDPKQPHLLTGFTNADLTHFGIWIKGIPMLMERLEELEDRVQKLENPSNVRENQEP